MGFFSNISKRFSSPNYEEEQPKEQEGGYVELYNTPESTKSKVTVRPFVIEDFEDIKPILDALREGTTIALVNIKPLKEKDVVELKRAVNKLKKTTHAIDGDIAGFGDDYVVLTPEFASIYRSKSMPSSKVMDDHGSAPELERY